MGSILGNRVVRVEDPRFLTSGGCYVDDIDVGMTIEPTQFPDAWCLVAGLREALDAYRTLVPVAGRHGQRPRQSLRHVVGRRPQSI